MGVRFASHKNCTAATCYFQSSINANNEANTYTHMAIFQNNPHGQNSCPLIFLLSLLLLAKLWIVFSFPLWVFPIPLSSFIYPH